MNWRLSTDLISCYRCFTILIQFFAGLGVGKHILGWRKLKSVSLTFVKHVIKSEPIL